MTRASSNTVTPARARSRRRGALLVQRARVLGGVSPAPTARATSGALSARRSALLCRFALLRLLDRGRTGHVIGRGGGAGAALAGPCVPAALADRAAGRAGTLPARRAGRRRHRRGRVSPGRRELGEADGELGLDQPLQLAVERRLDQLLHLAVALLEHGVHDAGDALLERRGHKGESTTPPAVLP